MRRAWAVRQGKRSSRDNVLQGGTSRGSRISGMRGFDAMVLWDRASFPGAVIACPLIGLVGVEQNSKKTPGTRERATRSSRLRLAQPLGGISRRGPLASGQRNHRLTSLPKTAGF
jgi:hypothetical protein